MNYEYCTCFTIWICFHCDCYCYFTFSPLYYSFLHSNRILGIGEQDLWMLSKLSELWVNWVWNYNLIIWEKICFVVLAQRGRVVIASELKSVGRGFKSRSDRLLMLSSKAPAEFNFSATLVNSQLVCLPPVGILNLIMLFEYLFINVCIGPEKRRWAVSIKYTFH